MPRSTPEKTIRLIQGDKGDKKIDRRSFLRLAARTVGAGIGLETLTQLTPPQTAEAATNEEKNRRAGNPTQSLLQPETALIPIKSQKELVEADIIPGIPDGILILGGSIAAVAGIIALYRRGKETRKEREQQAEIERVREQERQEREAIAREWAEERARREAREQERRSRYPSEEQQEKNREIAREYFIESGCIDNCNKLEASLRRQGYTGNPTFYIDGRPTGDTSFWHLRTSSDPFNADEVWGSISFHWFTPAERFRIEPSEHTFRIEPVERSFSIEVMKDGSILFTGNRPPSHKKREAGYPTTASLVTLDKWRNNKESIDQAFMRVYHDPVVWDEEYRRSYWSDDE